MALPSPSSPSILGPSARISSYVEYVQILTKLKPEFEWLAHFLRAPTPKPASSTHVIIVDSENGQMIEKSIPLIR